MSKSINWDDVPDEMFEDMLHKNVKAMKIVYGGPNIHASTWTPFSFMDPVPTRSDDEPTPVIQLTEEQIRQMRKDSGLCPTCGVPGEWKSLAMTCKEHGVFIG